MNPNPSYQRNAGTEHSEWGETFECVKPGNGAQVEMTTWLALDRHGSAFQSTERLPSAVWEPPYEPAHLYLSMFFRENRGGNFAKKSG